MKYLRILFSVLLVSLLCAPTELYANVFAHNVRVTQQGGSGPFDGRFSDGTGIAIRFVLSDHADSVVAVIKDGGATVRTFTTVNLTRGDTAVIWDGKDNSGMYVTAGNYSYTVELTTYDKGYATYTTVYDEDHGIFTRGVTAITNPNLKNFGFIYTADNGGYNGKGTGVMRHAADGTEWGDVKGAAKVNTTGSVIGNLLRYSSEADEEGYIYLLNRSSTLGQVHRYHTDSLNIAMVDSGGGYNTIIQGIGIRGTGSGRYLAIAGYQKIYGFLLGNNATYFGTKDIIADGDSTVEYYDVAFGRDSMMYATYYYTAKDTSVNKGRSGIVKFNLTGYTGTPLKLTDAVWTTLADTGKTTTMVYYKNPNGETSDVLYYVINGGGSPATGIYAVTNLTTTPSVAQVYVDATGGNSAFRADVTVDAVGNVIHFENSTENVAIISPPTGANNFTTSSSFDLKVVNSIPIADAVVDGDGDFKPDSLGKTVTVVGIVNSKNFQGASNTQFTIQDDNAGIMIFKSGGGGPALKIGDRVVVTGAIAQYRGTTEITPANFSDIIVLDTANALSPVSLTIPQYLANAEMYESRFIKLIGVAKKSTSPAWPAAGADANMKFWDGWDSVVVRIDKDADVDGSTEPAYPVSVQGVATQFTSSSSVYNDGYQLTPNDSTDFTPNVSVAPNPHFALVAPANGSIIVLDSAAQTVIFTWNKALDLNGDNLIYQWVPVGFSAVTTGNSGADSFLVRTGSQLAAMLGTKDTLDLQWSVKTKDPSNPTVNNIDTLMVKIVRGNITGVEFIDGVPIVFSLEQNYPNPFNPTTTIKYSLPAESRVILKIYNMLGQEVTTLVNNEQQSQGYYTATFNASNLASGMYIYRIEAGSFTSVKKMMLLK